MAHVHDDIVLCLDFFKGHWITHSKKCWVVLTQLWAKYGQTQPLG